MMLAFTNTVITKQELITSLERHHDADAIKSGIYGEMFGGAWKGCAVGCSLHDFHESTSDHTAYERLFGIPKVLARLEECIFEGLNGADQKAWPLQFAHSIQIGADLSLVDWRFLADTLRHLPVTSSQPVVDTVIALLDRLIAGENHSALVDEFDGAAEAARAAESAGAAAECKRQSEVLIRLLSEAPVKEHAK